MMKNLMEISKLLLTIDTRYFMEEDLSEIDLQQFDLISPFYNKDGVKILLVTKFEHDDEDNEDYEIDYLYASGLTKEEKDRIEETAQIIYRNTICNR